MVLTKDGLCQAYFKGTAIKTRTNSDNPSSKATNRNLPILVFKNFIIIKKDVNTAG